MTDRKAAAVSIAPSGFASPSLLDMTLEDAYYAARHKLDADREAGIVSERVAPIWYRRSVRGYEQLVDRWSISLDTSCAGFTTCISSKALVEIQALPLVTDILRKYEIVSAGEIEHDTFGCPGSLSPLGFHVERLSPGRGRIYQLRIANAGFTLLSTSTGITMATLFQLGVLLAFRKSVDAPGLLAKVITQTINPEIDNLVKWLQFRDEDLQRRAEKLKL